MVVKSQLNALLTRTVSKPMVPTRAGWVSSMSTSFYFRNVSKIARSPMCLSILNNMVALLSAMLSLDHLDSSTSNFAHRLGFALCSRRLLLFQT